MVAKGTLSLVDPSEVTVGNTTSNPVPISDGGGSLTVDGSVAVNNFPPAQSVVGAGAAATAQRVQLSDESLAALENITVQVGEVEIKNEVGNPVPISATALPLPTGAATAAKQLPDNHQVSVSNFPATQAVSATDLDIRNLSSAQDSVTVTGTVTVAPTAADTNVTGTWGYLAGTSGTVTVPAGGKVLQISATSLLGGSFTVNGGQAITIPANQQFTLEPRGNLVAPSIVFTSTTSYVVEYVS